MKTKHSQTLLAAALTGALTLTSHRTDYFRKAKAKT